MEEYNVSKVEMDIHKYRYLIGKECIITRDSGLFFAFNGNYPCKKGMKFTITGVTGEEYLKISTNREQNVHLSGGVYFRVFSNKIIRRNK